MVRALFCFIFSLLVFKEALCETKIKSVDNVKLLREKQFGKKEDYSFEIDENGVYVEPRIRNNFSEVYLPEKEEGLKSYRVNSNVGVDFNKYFTGYLVYDLGRVGVSSTGINSNSTVGSTIKVNGIGSKINVSDDVFLRFMYTQDELDSGIQENLGVDKNQELEIKGTIKF